MEDFHGYPVRQLTSASLELDLLATAGPRIVGLRYKGSGNLLADVADVAIPTPYGEYRYLGGHRLWHSPEAMPRSYLPDGDGLAVSEVPDGLILEGKVEPGTGIRKRLEICLNPEQPQAILTHTLTNEGFWDVELAPWAITMFRLGGTAILPFRAEQVNAKALLPDRHITLWPYARVDDPRLTLQDDFIVVRPRAGAEPFKIGTFNPRGWTAYWVENVLFRKSYAVRTGGLHPDNNCSAEIYTDGRVIELESLGALGRLSPGASVTHIETWELYDSLEQDFLSEQMRQVLGTSNR